MTTKPHSNDEWREKMYEWCERNCKKGEFHFGSLIQIMYDELAQKDAEMKQVTAYALNVLKYCEQHPEKIGFYASANLDTITDAVVKGNVDHVGKLVSDARREIVEEMKQIARTNFDHYQGEKKTINGHVLLFLSDYEKSITPPDQTEDITKCPECGDEADNGFDRCMPPNAYLCSKCNPTN